MTAALSRADEVFGRLRLLASTTGYGGGATFGYDAEGNQTTRTDPSGAVSFGYDNAGRITSIVDPLTGLTATRGYDTAGRLNSISYGAGKPTRTLTYDTLGRIDTDTWRKPDATITSSVDYNYDNDDLLVQKTTTGVSGAGANFYTYDGLGRVTSWLCPARVTTGYGWDAASNRTTVTTPAGTRTSTFETRNRIISTTGARGPTDSYAWSPRGSLVSATRNAQTTTYQFDAFERLASVAKSGGYSATFGYDGLDRPAQRNGANFGYADLSNNPVLSPAAARETKLLRDPTGAVLSSKAGAAACVAFYAGRYLTRHWYGREGLRVRTDFQMATDRPARVARIRIAIRPPAGFPPERVPALLAVASHCTVHNSITAGPQITVTVD